MLLWFLFYAIRKFIISHAHDVAVYSLGSLYYASFLDDDDQ
jgi:hypothetical protein